MAEACTIAPIATDSSIATNLSPFMGQETRVLAWH